MNNCYYTVFNTRWGYFGFLVDSKGLVQTSLPANNSHIPQTRLLQNLEKPPVFERNLLVPLQQKICAYFEGTYIDFFDVNLYTGDLSELQQKVLTRCRQIKPGQTLAYSQLAKDVQKPKSARAVANALAENPLPLLIPCHRVICADGSEGGFSASEQKDMKSRLLEHEKPFAG